MMSTLDPIKNFYASYRPCNWYICTALNLYIFLFVDKINKVTLINFLQAPITWSDFYGIVSTAEIGAYGP
jgi:hypothetical protein